MFEIRALGRPVRIGATAFCALLVLVASARPALPDGIARGDAAFLRRAKGGRDGRAAPEPIGEAIRAYQEAVATEPRDLEARWKLLRALHFEGDFAMQERDAKRRVFDRARTLSEEATALLAERVGGGEQLHELSTDALQERFAEGTEPPHDVAAFYFWSAINWAAWSQVSGLLSAVRRGVAGRLRDYTLVVLVLEPDYEEGGADRMMAALHARLPRVPFLSGWVDRSQALPHVERALTIAPEHPGNHLLFALTLLDLYPERRAEALAALEEVSALGPRPETEVEDLAVRREARERLELERAAAGERQ
jgi:tetratricopeptide (TPR) repeat protein